MCYVNVLANAEQHAHIPSCVSLLIYRQDSALCIQTNMSSASADVHKSCVIFQRASASDFLNTNFNINLWTNFIVNGSSQDLRLI